MVDDKTDAELQTENKVIEDKLVLHENDESHASRSQRRLIGKEEKTPAYNAAEVGLEQQISPFKNQRHVSDHLSPPIQRLSAFELTEDSKVATQDAEAEKSDEEESSFEQR